MRRRVIGLQGSALALAGLLIWTAAGFDSAVDARQSSPDSSS